MAIWNPIRSKRKTIISRLGDGINTAVPERNVSEGESVYLRNMHSQEYPALATRYGRSFFSTDMDSLSTPYALSERNNNDVHVVDGNTWKYWSTGLNDFVNLTTALSGDEQLIISDFVTGIDRYTLLMNSTQKLIWDGTSTASTITDVNLPYSSIFAVHRGRVFVASDNDVKFSAFQLPEDWTTVDNAGFLDVTQAKGEITGLVEYNDHIIVFTEYGMHELYGDDPNNFQLVNIEGEIGCISNRTITKVNKELYWLWHGGIYKYNGATVQKVSEPVKDYIDKMTYSARRKAISGSDSEYLYMAIPYESDDNNLLLVYDTRIDKWYIENGSFIDLVSIKNAVYGLDSTGGILDMRDISVSQDNGVAIDWEFTTKPFSEGTISQKKTLSDMWLSYKASTDASFTCGYSTVTDNNDSTSFTTIGNSTDFSYVGEEVNSIVQIPTDNIQDVDWYKLRFAGSGSCEFYGLERNYRIKAR